jgi:hypothetical protein
MMGGALTKEEIVGQIAVELGVTAPRMSTGSTEPKEIFIQVDDVLGMRLSSQFQADFGRNPTKPELAKLIVNASGNLWLPSFESRGGTVTRDGLLAVLDAVRFFLGNLR